MCSTYSLQHEVTDRGLTAVPVSRRRAHSPIEELKQWFASYAAGYNHGDAARRYHIELKRRHSLRVCAQMKHLALQMGLTAADVETAQILGLLHDVGRFEQYDRFQTFVDSRSLDHAAVGAQTIQHQGLLSALEPARRDQIIGAVRHHNKAALPGNLKGKHLFWARLIRDGDKLDIWRVLLCKYCSPARRKKNPTDPFRNFPVEAGLSDKVYDAVMAGEIVDMRDVNCLNDAKLLQMAWVFDLNFSPAFHMVRRRQYLEKIYGTMPATPGILRAYRHIRNFLEKRTTGTRT